MKLDELFDRIDAHVFTGDTFHDEAKRKDFREWMARWERGLKEMDEPEPKSVAVVVRELMQEKMDSMYEENKISKSDMDQIRMFDHRMFIKAYEEDRSTKYTNTFENFTIYGIQRDGGFTEVDKDELDMNEWALEVLEHLYNMDK